MSNDIKVLYTAEATVTGGREGHGRTSDGRLDVDLDVPSEMGGTGGPGTNPEQLFAVGYAACFQSALLRIATGRKLDVSGSRITACRDRTAQKRRLWSCGRARPRSAWDQSRGSRRADGVGA
jgi:Ohr subfamily peroxiredoxin